MSRVIFLIILGMLITQPSWSKESMKKCSRICQEDISVEECINDELRYWENASKKELLKTCKFLIRENYKECMEECMETKK